MIGRIVEISTDNKHLSIDRGFLIISEDKKEIGKIALDTIEAVIVYAHGITYSNNVLVKLAEQKSPLVICNSSFLPTSMLIPIDCNYSQASIMDAQIEATEPTKKRLWQQITKTKLLQQASVLEYLGKPYKCLQELAKNVKSGDTENREGEGARKYFPLLFGKDFIRDRDAKGINLLLNYGYTILRSSTARAILAAGLHPTLGLHHKNQYNPFRLADDLIEPFRPLVDITVYKLIQDNKTELNKETKSALVNILSENMPALIGWTEVGFCIQALATSLAQIYLGKRNDLETPLIMEKEHWNELLCN
jgi:CRISP-associated protein Cas1